MDKRLSRICFRAVPLFHKLLHRLLGSVSNPPTKARLRYVIENLSNDELVPLLKSLVDEHIGEGQCVAADMKEPMDVIRMLKTRGLTAESLSHLCSDAIDDVTNRLLRRAKRHKPLDDKEKEDE